MYETGKSKILILNVQIIFYNAWILLLDFNPFIIQPLQADLKEDFKEYCTVLYHPYIK